MPQNYDELSFRLVNDSLHSEFMRTVQQALRLRGNWKNKPRGIPNKNFNKEMAVTIKRLGLIPLVDHSGHIQEAKKDDPFDVLDW